MIVCHCHCVTDREIRALVQSGKHSVEAVSRACGAASACGGCMDLVAEVVSEETGVRSLPVIASTFLARSETAA